MTPRRAHPCARCPRVFGVSCCEVKDDEQLATLTWADVGRLVAATGQSFEAFAEWEWLDEAQAAKWLELHSSLAPYFGTQSRRLTLRRKNGACVFLGPSGCSLTADERPIACRLYPFEIRPHGEWGLQVDRHGSVEEAAASGEHACLAVEEADSFDALCSAFGTSREALEALAVQQGLEAKAHRGREQGLYRSDRQ